MRDKERAKQLIAELKTLATDRGELLHINELESVANGEEWRDIAGHQGYQVSNLGRVRSYKRGYWYMLKPFIDQGGYRKVSLEHNKSVGVHRLVAGAFISNPDNKPEVNHIDRDKINNRVENLEWVTRSENMSHVWRTGRRPVYVRSDETEPHAKLTNDQVRWIREHCVLLDKNYGCRALARQFGVRPGTISKIVKNESYRDVK